MTTAAKGLLLQEAVLKIEMLYPRKQTSVILDLHSHLSITATVRRGSTVEARLKTIVYVCPGCYVASAIAVPSQL